MFMKLEVENIFTASFFKIFYFIVILIIIKPIILYIQLSVKIDYFNSVNKNTEFYFIHKLMEIISRHLGFI